MMPVPSGFGQNQHIAFLNADVAKNFVGMNHAGDRHAEFNFFIDDAVAADDRPRRFL